MLMNINLQLISFLLENCLVYTGSQVNCKKRISRHPSSSLHLSRINIAVVVTVTI